MRIEVRDVRTMSLLPIRRTSAMAVSRMVVASSRGRAERSMRTTAVFLAVVASGAGKEPRKATVCVRGSVRGTSVERAEEHVTLVQGRTVAENTLELKLAEGRDVGEGGRHGEREEEQRRAIGAITAAGAPLSATAVTLVKRQRRLSRRERVRSMVVFADGLPSMRGHVRPRFKWPGGTALCPPGVARRPAPVCQRPLSVSRHCTPHASHAPLKPCWPSRLGSADLRFWLAPMSPISWNIGPIIPT